METISQSSIQQLQRDVRQLKDRQEILDCIMRHARGVDRHDSDLLDGCYHDDGAAAYGSTIVPAREHSEWSNNAHAGRFSLHAHHITTHTCEIANDTAYAESYAIAAFLSPDRKRTSFVSARYVDQLERRDGEWKIAARRSMTDIAVEGDASFLGAFRGRPVEDEHFTRDDLSYQRPIDLSKQSPPWH